MRRPSALLIFVASAMAWILVLTIAWSKVSPWTSYPVALLSHAALEQMAPVWVRKVNQHLGVMEIETTIAMPVPNSGGQRADVIVDVDPGRYAYGLPIFIALLLAARSKGLWRRAAIGYVLLLPAQAFSLTMFALIQVVTFAQTSARILNVEQWQLEGIVYLYQLGSLVVPTLVPIMLWLWLDRRFFRDVVVTGWKGNVQRSLQNEAPGGLPTLPASGMSAGSMDPGVSTDPHSNAGIHAAEAPGAPVPTRPATDLPVRPAKPLVSSSASAGLPVKR